MTSDSTAGDSSIDGDVGRESRQEIAIIGAGLSGLAAAQVLLDGGRSVTLVDKGRGVGGRLATRRIDDATLDHGAQFFTVRGNAFREVVDLAIAEGAVDTWCHGFDADDGYPRYRGTKGMNGFAKWLAARVEQSGGTIIKSTRVASITAEDATWRLNIDDGSTLEASNVITTAPVPQTLDLLTAGKIELEGTIAAELSTITYKPTLALMVTLDGPGAVPQPGGVQRTEEDLFTFLADNHQKGVSAKPALTFHVNGDVTAARWDDSPDDIISDLLPEASPWIGSANVVKVQLHKWKFAGPHVPHPDPCVVARREPGLLVLAGDAFAGPKVEGAFNSGQAAGHTVLSA
ncbi:MAG: FAD-dependent oxidoreductase [Acidimicrobiia bacterium]|nr:FAD-dependent oxidoreductase [Acidimicrobiia bacterium]